MGIIYALITVLAWGTWLAPSQKISFKNQQIKTFYVAAANLILSTVIFLFQPTTNLTFSLSWPSFLGGLIWSISGFLAFSATNRLGMARAFGIWTPINVAVSIFWGALIFGEFLSVGPTTLLLLGLSILILIVGVLLIIFAKGTGKTNGSRQTFWIGLLSAIGAGVLWGTYFIPIKWTNASMWLLTFPMSVGIFAGSAVLVGLSRQKIFLQSPGEYARVACTGLLWGLGNYGMLLLIDQLGAGRGFTISQLGVVVNALMGVFLFKDPHPKSKAAILTLAGSILACVGGILLGSLK